MQQEYTSKDIQQLPFPECVRKRPQIYLSNLDKNGALTCLREIINNSVDEFLRGFSSAIHVVRISETTFRVEDNGRGVPFDVHPSGKNALEVIFGELHSGRNFSDEKKEYTTGLNGVGASCVNAVSNSFKVQSVRSPQRGFIEFEKGLKKNLLLTKVTKGNEGHYKTGTVVTFELDSELFEENAEEDDILRLLKDTASLNNGLTITYKTFSSPEIHTWMFTNGMENFINEKINEKERIVSPVSFSEKDKDIILNVSFAWSPKFRDEEIFSFCNTIRTSDGGVHVTGFKRALSQHVTEYVKTNKLAKDIENEDVFNGLTAFVSVFVLNPKYETQTKQKLTNKEVNGYAFSIASKNIKLWLDKNGKDLKKLAERFSLTAKARLASKRALESVQKDNKSFLTSLNSISKFSDCLEDNPEKNELIIVEGSSAAGTVCDARDSTFQCVYELKGKPLNVLGVGHETVYRNKELSDLISIMKCGIGEGIDSSKCKYNKIIIAADADDDGCHIKSLMISNYFVLFKELVKENRLFLAVPPLYRLTANGKKPVYLKNSQELDNFYLDKAEELFTFTKDNKVVANKKEKRNIFQSLQTYARGVEAVAKRYLLSPECFEQCLIKTFNLETYEFACDKKVRIDINNDNQISIIGYHWDEATKKEYFLSLVQEDIETLITDLIKLKTSFLDLSETIGISRNNSKNVEKISFYSSINSISEIVSKTYSILRFKGLGEANADELWETTLNPETRDLILITTEDLSSAEQAVKDFLGDDADIRKTFIQSVFSSLDRSDLSF